MTTSVDLVEYVGLHKKLINYEILSKGCSLHKSYRGKKPPRITTCAECNLIYECAVETKLWKREPK